MSGKKWTFRRADPESVERLSRELRISSVGALMLVNRGLEEASRARRFLEPSLHQLDEPANHPPLQEAAEFLHRAVTDRRRITIYGDYDADGICATALLVNCLRGAGALVDFYVPHRVDEGYGLNLEALDELAGRGTEVVVTVDCGTCAYQEAAYAARLGLDLLVTDHHEPGPKAPIAAHTLNPKLPDCELGCRHLAGVGVAFKLAWALGSRLGGGGRAPEAYRDLLVDSLALVATGTIADVVPLTGENRTLAHYGLKVLPRCTNPGIQALLHVARADGKSSLSSFHVSYQLAPRLNAAGRMTDARVAVEMLTTSDPRRAAELAEHLERQNRLRQNLQRATLEEAKEQVESGQLLERCACIVLSSPEWHVGIAGLVASRLAETYWRPTFILCEESRLARGSARSVPGFHLFEALSRCDDLLERFGGHEGAAGLTVAMDKLPSFTRRMTDIAQEVLGPEPPGPELNLEGELSLSELAPHVVEEIARLAPFGAGNPEPLFAANGLRLAGNPQLVGSGGRHLAFLARQGDTTHRVIAFGHAEWLKELTARGTENFALAFEPRMSTYTGHPTVELRAEDIRWESEAGEESPGV